MAYFQSNHSPYAQQTYCSPSSTPFYFSARTSSSTQPAHTRSPPTSTTTPRSRTRSTSAIPPSYGYGSPKTPQEPSNPLAEMGIDPVRMYLQHFNLPDTPENRRDAWEIVGRVAQRILEKEEAEARAQQSMREDEDSDYADYLAFKEYTRRKRRSSQAGHYSSPPTSQPMLFNPGPAPGHSPPAPAPGTCYYPKTPATTYHNSWPQSTAGPVPSPPQTTTPAWTTRSTGPSPSSLGRPQKAV